MGDDDIYRVRVENIFEGPMDLLIHLIKKNEVDVYDIPVALITDQYLEYLEWMQAMNLDLAGDFLLMASTLTYIKSRMLLPVHSGKEDEEEDPRMEIARPLVEYIRMKSAAQELSKRCLLGEYTFTRPSAEPEIVADSQNAFVQIGLFELVEAFKNLLENISAEHRMNFEDDQISIKDRISQVVEILEKKGSITFSELFEPQTDRGLIVVTFLAILEMIKMSLVRAVQNIQTGSIRLFYL